MGKTKIEWTATLDADGVMHPGYTFNPWWGCTKVSDGCKNCYAETLAKRYGFDVWGLNTPRRLMSDNHWQQPIKWDAEGQRLGIRYRVFCASMADVFEENAPESESERLWKLIRNTPNLDWQLLTKRPHRIADNLPGDWGNGYSNVWLGTSVEDERVVERIGHLVSVPAVIHFLSLEPLIGPLPNLPLSDIDWVIVGGESGAGARPMDEAWVLDIRRQCRSSRVSFFFKQWGGVNKKKAGRELQKRLYNEMPVVIVTSQH